ncbi:ATP-binding protein [Kineococcus gynurae]|uniref:ATP-binding protein n=1 Tax=Kineococcus gynurae TaxID=452979 RepID=A0ABV5LU32_9ACTN
MPTVALRFSSLPEHVRTARLVAVSVARRAGFGENQLDEIRIAVGEACGQAVTRSGGGLVGMTLCDDDDRLDVRVDDLGGPPVEGAVGPSAGRHLEAVREAEARDVAELATALLEGVSDSVSLRHGGGPAGTVQMSWELDKH